MRFQTLGPLRVRTGGAWSAIGAAHQRLLLAVLLIEAGKVVSTQRLVHEIWGEHPRKTAVHAVHVYVQRLRALLGGDILVTRGRGYELTEADTDANTFEHQVAAARRSSHPSAKVSRLSEALSHWQGAAFGDVPPSPLVSAEALRLEQARLTAIEDRLESLLELGRVAEVVDECQHLTAFYPLREKLHAHHLLALYRAGRRGDALHAYQRARTTLVQELGLEPGRLLQERHRAILNDDPHLLPAPAHPARLDDLPNGLRIVAVTGDAHEAATLYRGLLAGKRMLILLDNGPLSFVLVTSRDDLVPRFEHTGPL